MGKHHNRQYPGESSEYRAARDKLLDAELELRKKVIDVAALRSQLPPGGSLKEDYQFEESESGGKVRTTRFSELFEAGKDTLIAYSFMYGPDWDKACPMCTSLLDGYNGNAAYVRKRANFVVIAKAPAKRLQQWADSRNWKNLRLLSSEKNSFNNDYFSEWKSDYGDQHPLINVFVKKNNEIRHHWSSEQYFAKVDGHPRHADMTWPLWNLLDLTPEGRGTDWWPNYEL